MLPLTSPTLSGHCKERLDHTRGPRPEWRYPARELPERAHAAACAGVRALTNLIKVRPPHILQPDIKQKIEVVAFLGGLAEVERKSQLPWRSMAAA